MTASVHPQEGDEMPDWQPSKAADPLATGAPADSHSAHEWGAGGGMRGKLSQPGRRLRQPLGRLQPPRSRDDHLAAGAVGQVIEPALFEPSSKCWAIGLAACSWGGGRQRVMRRYGGVMRRRVRSARDGARTTPRSARRLRDRARRVWPRFQTKQPWIWGTRKRCSTPTACGRTAC